MTLVLSHPIFPVPADLGMYSSREIVDPFTSEKATELPILRVDIPAHRLERVEAEAVKIVQELSRLSLAVEQAAAYIRVQAKDIFKFLALYNEYRKVILAERPRQNWD